MGREAPAPVPTRPVRSAWSMPPLARTELLPGRAKPVIGRPDDETGRMAASRPLAPLDDADLGALNDVPGRGTDAVVFSSSITSPIPSSSSSVSSM